MIVRRPLPTPRHDRRSLGPIRRAACLLASAGLVLGGASRAIAQTPPAPARAESTAPEIVERDPDREPVDTAIERAAAYLVEQQDAETGRMPGRFPITLAACTVLALTHAGRAPGLHPQGDAVERGVRFILANQDAAGYFGHDGGRMYGHALAVLALCQVAGMMPDAQANREVHQAIGRGVALIVRAQQRDEGVHRGGWRYLPGSNDADLSVTAWQIKALHAAANCGIPAPEDTLRGAAAYVASMYEAESASFRYTYGRGGSPAMRYAGALASRLASTGPLSEAARERVDRALAATEADPLGFDRHFYYGCYYAAHTAESLAEPARSQRRRLIARTLTPLQRADGSFAKHRGHAGGVYATSMAMICLALPRSPSPMVAR